MAYGRTHLFALVCLLVSGCGSFHAPSANASSARVSTPSVASEARTASGSRLNSPCPTPQAPPGFTASPTSNRNLVLGKLRGSDQTVVRDITDIDHPSTIATVEAPGWTGSSWASPSFASQTAISYVAAGQLIRRPISNPQAQVITVGCSSQFIVTFRWSPDGQSFTYVVDPLDVLVGGAFQWHLVAGGIDRVVGTAPLWCYCGNGSEDFSVDIGFSPDGQFTWLVEYVGLGSDLQVRRQDGSLVGAEIRGDRNFASPPTMGVWSGTDLFFRDAQGVERWSGGAIKPFLPGVAWLHPRASPNGGQLVYAVRGRDGLARVNMVDVVSGQTRELSSQPRTLPVYLSPRYIWYKGERLCVPSEPGICTKTTFTGTTYIYDLQTGTETESVITDIADVWPHGA